MKRGTYQQWIARLNWLADHDGEREAQRATCALLGHEPSGEQLMTAPPTDLCWWCADRFQKPLEFHRC